MYYSKLSQWLCHDDSTINIVLVIIIIIIIKPTAHRRLYKKSKLTQKLTSEKKTLSEPPEARFLYRLSE